MMQKFYVTFGQKYRLGQRHPTFPDAHPDGVIEVEAQDYDAARDIVIRNLGAEWSGLYSDMEFAKDRHYYPLGVLAKWAQVRQGPEFGS
jgi:hypothetical protein